MRNGTETKLWPAGPPCRPLYPVRVTESPTAATGSNSGATTDPDAPPHRYTAALAGRIESTWQENWAKLGTFNVPNPVGSLAPADGTPVPADKLFVQDMFPYPSGEGLHVGHPLGYIATDVYARYFRMTGHNVLHALGFDSFGLPAEQYAVQTGTHPRTRTEANVVNFRRQLGRLGLGHDSRRSFSTTDVEFYKWTQWIFLQIYNAWFDTAANKARPIAELIAEFDSGARPSRGRTGLGHAVGGGAGRRDRQPPAGLPGGLDGELVPGAGHGAGQRRGHRRRPQRPRQLPGVPETVAAVDDADHRLCRPAARRPGRAGLAGAGQDHAAQLDRPLHRRAGAVLGNHGPMARQVDIEVFTTRPDTMFGATYLVLAPEHDLVDGLVATAWPDGTDPAGRTAPPRRVRPSPPTAARSRAKSDLERQESKEKTGVFLGSYATNPANGKPVPIFVADYVLAGYGTGAIMAVPGHDQRDWDFAREFRLPIVEVIAGGDISEAAHTGDGVLVNSGYLDGMDVAAAKEAITARLEADGRGRARIEFKLRDWLFARQRYWGEPFPIVYDGDGRPHALDEAALPVELPDVPDYSPVLFDPDDADSEPSPPLAKATEWVHVELDLGDGLKPYTRDTNVMPQWAGSSWYELRYTDPHNSERFCAKENEAYWMGPRPAEHGPQDPGGVDLYVGGAEHAVLHLLYARFWHKVLYDLGHVSSREPYRRLINQGYIQAFAYTDSRGSYVPGRRGDRTRRPLLLSGARRRDRGLSGVRENR